MPTISVVLAAYRGEKYIGEQLRSLFAQTRLPDEILIGDDSPDDATRRAIADVLPEKPASVQLEVIVNPQQLGHLKNFENLCAQAGGDFIFFCDQDDVWLPEKIATLSAVLANHSDKMLAFGDSIRADATLTKFYDRLLLLSEDNAETEVAAFNNGNAFARVLRGKLWLSLHNVAIRREFRDVILPVPSGYSYFDLWLNFIAAFYETSYCVNRVLTHYRVHANNASAPSLLGGQRTAFGRLMLLIRRIIEIARHGTEAEYRQIYEMSTALRERLVAASAKLSLPDSQRCRNEELLNATGEFYRRRMEVIKQPRYRRLPEIWRLRNNYPRFVPARWRSMLRDLLG
ncbi:glycosyl transferase [Planctomycetales bacterium]|nr:glycosyl transferase [Planctomycetales bacterium]GHS96513.1 glycosyl transferase [Planctomycetales bacterium]GHT05255.1 glycosyl transferase [Planctomycetales bacterium]